MQKFLITITVLLLICALVCVDGQRNRGRGRGRNRKPKGSCHLKEIDQCIGRLDKYNSNNSSKLLTTSRGLDEICTNSLDVVTCFRNYMTKCGTPLQRELFEFAIEQFSKSIDQFCKPGPLREEFLRNSPCIVNRVISKSNYKDKCVNNFLSTIDKTNKLKEMDDRLDTICCSYNRWEGCVFNLIEKECTEKGKIAMQNFIDKAFGGLTNLICSSNAFDPASQRCTSLYAAPGARPKGKLSDNPVTKYIASYFGFLFT
ncbi:uncharacterized protein LOC141855353 [Brevipalpus obovatus]|uniref:uncharacterized protein LOC141855353 n=1 Tax=Brevipalpus obovatus TaxID=246614 RepID=UPI003D9E1C77